MANELRTRDGLPFNFVDGLRIKGVDVTNWEKIFIDQGASYVGFTPVGNLAATNVQAAIAELENEKQSKSEPIANATTAVNLRPGANQGIVWDNDAFGGTQDTASITLETASGEATKMRFKMTNDSDDNFEFTAKTADGLTSFNNAMTLNGNVILNAANYMDYAAPMISDYSSLRTYTGSATQVRITSTGLSGFFYYDAVDTTSADNGGTVIVSNNGKRWKRLFDGAVNVKWFGAKGDWNGTTGTDDTAAIQAALDNAYNIFLPKTSGKYKTTAPLVQKNTFRIYGEGGNVSIIENTASDVFYLGKLGGLSNQSVIENIGIISAVGGGHIFVQKSDVLYYEFRNLYLEQLNPAKSIYSHTADLGNHIGNEWHGGRYYHAYGATAPGFNFIVSTAAGATNWNRWRNVELVRPSKPWFYFESKRESSFIFDTTLHNVAFSVASQGCLIGKGVSSLNLENVSIYDLAYNQYLNSANLFEFFRGTNTTANQPSRHIHFKNFKRITGDSQLNGFQDVLFNIPSSGSCAEDVTFEDCTGGSSGSIFVSSGTSLVSRPVAFSSKLVVVGDAIPSYGTEGAVNIVKSSQFETLTMLTTANSYPLAKTTNVLFCDPTDAPRTITGIASPTALAANETKSIIIYNINTTNNLTILHAGASAPSAQFYCPGAANKTVPPLSGVTAVYNFTLQKWCILS